MTKPAASRTGVPQKASEQQPAANPVARHMGASWASVAAILAAGLVASAMFCGIRVFDRRATEVSLQLERAELRLQERELAAEGRAAKARELQAIGAFLPFVLGPDEAAKQTALVTLSALGFSELAAKLSEQVGGRGGMAALSVIANAEAADETVRTGAQQALEALVRPFEGALAHVKVHDPAGRRINYRGNAFVVDADGYLITTVHPFDTIAGAAVDITVHFGSALNEGVKADVVAMNAELALLRIDSVDLLPVVFAEGADAAFETGAYVKVLSLPSETGGPVMASGRTVGVDQAGDVMIEPNADMTATGAPVFNAAGAVVGITRVVLGQPRGVVIPVSHLHDLLAKAGLRP